MVIASFVTVALCVSMLYHHSHVVVALIGIVFFGWCGLYILYVTLKERLTGKPFLTITDEVIIREDMKHTFTEPPTGECPGNYLHYRHEYEGASIVRPAERTAEAEISRNFHVLLY